MEPPFDAGDRLEGKAPVEGLGAGLDIDDDADTADIGRRSPGQVQGEAQQGLTDALPPRLRRDGQPGDTQHRQRIAWQALCERRQKYVDLNGGGRDGDESDKVPPGLGDIGHAQVVSELVLAREAMEK